MTQYFLTALQILSCLAGVGTAYSAFRARDNERAATLTELRAGIKALQRQLDDLQRRMDQLAKEVWEKKRGIA